MNIDWSVSYIMSLGKVTILLKYDDTNACSNKKKTTENQFISAWGVQKTKGQIFLYSPYRLTFIHAFINHYLQKHLLNWLKKWDAFSFLHFIFLCFMQTRCTSIQSHFCYTFIHRRIPHLCFVSFPFTLGTSNSLRFMIFLIIQKEAVGCQSTLKCKGQHLHHYIVYRSQYIKSIFSCQFCLTSPHWTIGSNTQWPC